MRAFISFTLITIAAALPQQLSSLIPRETLGSMTVEQANKACGADRQVSCCNKGRPGGEISTADLLTDLAEALPKNLTITLDRCSHMSVTDSKQ
jgi:hypothetical protein